MRLGLRVGQSAVDLAQDQAGRIAAVVDTNQKIAHFKGIAGRRFRVLFAGSTTMPIDSRAVTPNRGSEPGWPKISARRLFRP